LDGFSDADSLVFSDDDVFSELAEDEFEHAQSCSHNFWFQGNPGCSQGREHVRVSTCEHTDAGR
jgi:hypothetical protein